MKAKEDEVAKQRDEVAKRSGYFRPQICRNCGINGHLYKDCIHPIMSFGIICYKIENVEIKADEADKDFLFDVVATTSDTDRDNEIIKVDWRDTKNWEKNPVVLANHRYEIQSIIGKWLRFYTSDWVKRLKGVFSNFDWEIQLSNIRGGSLSKTRKKQVWKSSLKG